MEPFRSVTGIAVPFDRINVDTDQIIPARFIMKPRDYDYSTLLFHDLRFGLSAQPDFPLDAPVYRGARIMVTAANFGCGSAREQAAYALQDFGIRALIGPSFGDIFRTNCVKNGILLAQVDADVSVALCGALLAEPGAAMSVDLEQQVIVDPAQRTIAFRISDGDKAQLLSGKDDITRTLEHEARMDAFERDYIRGATWIRPPVGAVIEGG
jgi:3-isopropylmalate/(R)-2-methylmalate dehydratase small subunit